MQILIGIAVILLFAQEVSAAPRIVKRWSQVQDMQEINTIRGALGMQPLTYDQGLIDQYSGQGCQMTSGPHHRFAPIELNDDGNRLFALFLIGAAVIYNPTEFGFDEKEAAVARAQIEAALLNETVSLYYLEMLLPQQSTIGCFRLHCSVPATRENFGEAVELLSGKEVTSDTMCLLGPVGTAKADDMKKMGPQLEHVAKQHGINIPKKNGASSTGLFIASLALLYII